MATLYSNLYQLTNQNLGVSGGYQAINAANNCRSGESIWIRAVVAVPVGTAAADVLVLAPLVPGLRPVYGMTTASAANAGVTVNIGYESSPSAIVAASTNFATAVSTLLTPAQIAAVTVLTAKGTEAGQDRLQGVVGGTTTTLAANWTFLIQFVNFGS